MWMGGQEADSLQGMECLTAPVTLLLSGRAVAERATWRFVVLLCSTLSYILRSRNNLDIYDMFLPISL